MDEIELETWRSEATRQLIVIVQPRTAGSFVLELTRELDAAAANARHLAALIARVDVTQINESERATLTAWQATAHADERRVVELLARLAAVTTEHTE